MLVNNYNCDNLLFRFVIAQEHGDLINLHDWYQSFKSIVTCQSSKGKKRLKQSPVSKKRKDVGGFENLSEALIQYPFDFMVLHAIFMFSPFKLTKLFGHRMPLGDASYVSVFKLMNWDDNAFEE